MTTIKDLHEIISERVGNSPHFDIAVFLHHQYVQGRISKENYFYMLRDAAVAAISFSDFTGE